MRKLSAVFSPHTCQTLSFWSNLMIPAISATWLGIGHHVPLSCEIYVLFLRLHPALPLPLSCHPAFLFFTLASFPTLSSFIHPGNKESVMHWISADVGNPQVGLCLKYFMCWMIDWKLMSSWIFFNINILNKNLKYFYHPDKKWIFYQVSPLWHLWS